MRGWVDGGADSSLEEAADEAVIKLEVADNGLDCGPASVAFALLFALVIAVGFANLSG